MTDLFNLEPSSGYPISAGFKGLDATSRACSRDAAASIAGDASRLRKVAMATLATLGDATAEEVSALAGQFLNPRLSECKGFGWVVATGERRKTQSGRSGAILRLTVAGRAVIDE
jgi:hypothetical protein